MFSCERCGYSTVYKSNLRNHYNRKNVCKPKLKNISIKELKLKINQKINLIKNDSKLTPIDSKLTPIDSKLTPIDSKLTPIDSKMTPIDSKMTPIDSELTYLCQFCKKSYSKNSNLHRHMKNCKKDILVNDTKNEENLLKYITVIEKEKSVIEKENQLIKKEKEVLKKEIEKLLDKVGNTTINNQQNNIYINNYGNENLDYLTKGYLDNLLKIPYSSVLNLIKDTHFNPDHPENHNVKIPNRKEKYAIVYIDGEWLFKRKRDFISNMVDKSYNMIDCHFEDNKMILTDTKRNNFIEFMTDYEVNEKVKKGIEEEVEVQILNS